MDPNLFHVDWDRLFEVFFAIVVLAIFLERALSLVFEHRLYVKKLKGKGLKSPIAFLLAFVVCRLWDFDALSTVILQDSTSLIGQIITAGIIAGGCKGSVKMFRELMGWKSRAHEASQAASTETSPQPQGEA